MILSGLDLERQALRLYGELMARRDTWAGQLVFACGDRSSTNGLPAAVSIAGGTSLLLDPDPAAVKAAFRAGGVDFVVNTLDEALRVLKNEIRKHRPLSVALVGAVHPILDEMRERGVAPDLEVAFESPAKIPEAQTLHLTLESGFVMPSMPLQTWLERLGWAEVILRRPTLSAMRELDAHLLQLVRDPLRQTWIQRIGHYQRAATNEARVVWLTEAEQTAVSRFFPL